jgi:hypothetical protein
MKKEEPSRERRRPSPEATAAMSVSETTPTKRPVASSTGAPLISFSISCRNGWHPVWFGIRTGPCFSLLAWHLFQPAMALFFKGPSTLSGHLDHLDAWHVTSDAFACHGRRTHHRPYPKQ